MHKDILGPVFRSDEAETLGAVEELYSAGNSHSEKPFPVLRE
jgi:hypothetical protein